MSVYRPKPENINRLHGPIRLIQCTGYNIFLWIIGRVLPLWSIRAATFSSVWSLILKWLSYVVNSISTKDNAMDNANYKQRADNSKYFVKNLAGRTNDHFLALGSFNIAVLPTAFHYLPVLSPQWLRRSLVIPCTEMLAFGHSKPVGRFIVKFNTTCLPSRTSAIHVPSKPST